MLLLDSPKYEIVHGNPRLDFLVGLNVDGASCGTKGKPDVYLDTRTLVDWIIKEIRSDESTIQ